MLTRHAKLVDNSTKRLFMDQSNGLARCRSNEAGGWKVGARQRTGLVLLVMRWRNIRAIALALLKERSRGIVGSIFEFKKGHIFIRKLAGKCLRALMGYERLAGECVKIALVHMEEVGRGQLFEEWFGKVNESCHNRYGFLIRND